MYHIQKSEKKNISNLTAAILNSEKAKPVGQSHSSDFWSMVLVLSHETIKLSITRNKGGTVAASRLWCIVHDLWIK